MTNPKRKLGVMTHGEYEANKNGLNIFFGAISGVIFADAIDLPIYEYIGVLFGGDLSQWIVDRAVPVFGVWLFMTIFVEVLPRERDIKR